MPLDYKVTVERTDNNELTRLVRRLDVWCVQHLGLPGLDNLWHRNKNRFYVRKGQKRSDPKIYWTIYSFKEPEHAFEFKLANL